MGRMSLPFLPPPSSPHTSLSAPQGALVPGAGLCGATPRADESPDEWSYTLHMQGHGTTLGAEEQDEAVRLLHEAVFEVTGKRVEPTKHPVGFA